MFMLLLDITIVTVALPDIQRGLGASFSGLQWIVDAYALTLAAFLLTAGSLSDMYGRRLLFLIGLVVFTGASLLCGFATSTLMLQVSRAVQGVGGAIMFAVSLALLAGAFRGTDRGVAFGIWGAITGIAVAVGPLLGGVLTSGISWRWIFFVNAPVGAVAIVITVAKVAESRHPGAARPDWPGFVLFSLGLAGAGAGLVNPPLASTAVGVVRPERAGMASGINSTFRQVGIATSIAVLGTLFSHTVTGQVRATMTTVPGMSGRTGQVAGAVQSGQTGRLIAHLPARTGRAVAMVTRSAFTAGLNEILLVAAVIAVVSGLVSLAAIRGQDFVAQGPAPPGG
jgi:MFS family permease